MSSSITTGAGRDRLQGKLQVIDVSPVGLAGALEELPARLEQWWSPHRWEGDVADAANWRSAVAVVVDLNYHEADQHSPVPADVAARCQALAGEARLPGSIFHATPRGARVVFCLNQPVIDRQLMVAACRGAGAIVERALIQLDLVAFRVAQDSLCDLGRILWGPRAVVDGVGRAADVVLMDFEATPPSVLAAASPLEPLVPPSGGSAAPDVLAGAVARYNATHQVAWPRHGSRCPVCLGETDFAVTPADPGRWECFGPSHRGCGQEGPISWSGDSLDLAAWRAGCSRVELLDREGLLAPPKPARKHVKGRGRPNLRVVDGDGAQPEPAFFLDENAPAPDPSDPPSKILPIIPHTHEEWRANEKAIACLAAHPSVWQRGGQLVRITREPPSESEGTEDSEGSRLKTRRGISRPPMAPRIGAITRPVLRSYLTEVARFTRYKSSADRHEADYPWDWLVGAVHEYGNWPTIRRLEGIVESPIMRSDGTILSTPGYDPATGILFEPNYRVLLPPENPTRDDAIRATEELLDPVRDFPFVTDADRTAWLAGLLTPFCRHAIDALAPMLIIDANVPGVGKTKLANGISIVATGRHPAVAGFTEDNEEMRKQISTVALNGDNIVLLDNVSGVFGGSSLDRAITSMTWWDRMLGQNKDISAPLRVSWQATGNNVQVASDFVRRVLRSRIESKDQKPEERHHDRDFEAYVARRRPELVQAALTLLRAYCHAGMPDQDLPAWGSFEAWSDWVRGAIVWAGLEDPWKTRKDLAEVSDIEGSRLNSLLVAWRSLPGGTTPFNPKNNEGGIALTEVLKICGDGNQFYEDIRNVLLETCAGRNGDLPTAAKLGYILRKLKHRVGPSGDCFHSALKRTSQVWWVQPPQP